MTHMNRSTLVATLSLAALAAEMRVSPSARGTMDEPLVSALDLDSKKIKHFTLRGLTKDVNGLRSENAHWQGWNPKYGKFVHEMEDEHLANALSSINARIAAFDDQRVLFEAVYPDGRTAEDWAELISDELNYRYAAHMLEIVSVSKDQISLYSHGDVKDEGYRALIARHEASVKELINGLEDLRMSKEMPRGKTAVVDMLSATLGVPDIAAALQMAGLQDPMSEEEAARFKAAMSDPSQASGTARRHSTADWIRSVMANADVSGNKNARLSQEDLDRAKAAYEAPPAHETNEQPEQQQHQRGIPRYTNEDVMNNDPRM